MHGSSSHHRITGRRTSPIVAAALVIAAGCGGSDDSQPPLLLSQTNAQAVAAEALVATAQTTSGAQNPLGGLPVAAARSLRSADRRVVSRTTGAQLAQGTMTEACMAGGTTTTTATSTTATVTFSNCQETATTRINGSLTYTIKTTTTGGTPTGFSFSVAVNITVVAGALSYAESGGYDLNLTSTASGTEVALTGSRLSTSVSGGAVSDKLTLSNFDIDVKQDLSSTPGQQLETIDYDIDSTRLKGHISVTTTTPIAQILNAGIPHEFSHAGQIMIIGANHSRLQITILGDETYTPPAGEGQIKIELDTGSGAFSTTIWTSWTALSATAGSTP